MSKDNQRVELMFKDAESLFRNAIEELDKGKTRDAAEKSWGAMVRATNALILARKGVEIEGARETSKAFIDLVKEDREVSKKLRNRYFSRESSLHGHCFYMGLYDPEVEQEIRETNLYIEDAKKLTQKGGKNE